MHSDGAADQHHAGRVRHRLVVGRPGINGGPGAISADRPGPRTTQLLGGFDRYQHGFRPGDFNLVADLHFFESRLVLHLG
jgi:hypothetical protein